MKHGKNAQVRSEQKKDRYGKKFLILFLSLLLMTTMSVGATLSYLFATADPVVNEFTPAEVSCEVTEEFDGENKRNVNVINTGDTDVYIRVNLVSYRVNDIGQNIGGIAEIPAFTPGGNWVRYEDGYYYYTLPVKPGDQAASHLIQSIRLAEAYDDADKGKQVIDVIAEAIQSAPEEAIGTSWGVSISEGRVSSYTPTP